MTSQSWKSVTWNKHRVWHPQRVFHTIPLRSVCLADWRRSDQPVLVESSIWNFIFQILCYNSGFNSLTLTSVSNKFRCFFNFFYGPLTVLSSPLFHLMVFVGLNWIIFIKKGSIGCFWTVEEKEVLHRSWSPGFDRLNRLIVFPLCSDWDSEFISGAKQFRPASLLSAPKEKNTNVIEIPIMKPFPHRLTLAQTHSQAKQFLRLIGYEWLIRLTPLSC